VRTKSKTMIALSTGSLYNYGVVRVFELGREAGFEGVEILVDDRYDTQQPDYLNILQETFQLPVVAVHSPFLLSLQGVAS